MTIDSILAQIEAEIERLTQVRTLLAGADLSLAKTALPKVKKAAAVKGVKRHVLSPEARKRIADAQRKRWAAARAKAK